MDKKNARQPKPTSANEHRNSNGVLPTRVNTVTASFLAALLEGNTLTGMEAVFSQSTTRAAAWVHYLEGKYGWTIERREVADGTNDGRISWVTRYWLSDESIEASFAAGAREWIDRVQAATSKRRANVGEVKARAARINAGRGTGATW
ncbi:helix-turn-helix domain-containing protein [Paraburkholderia sp. A1RI-2L]|uniref:helix-turn-helix domain-containing protein n=1 Tax=Paraburkholderia sp. A1RI-2L TaxID=3028367 RepID=UPI003B79D52F